MLKRVLVGRLTACLLAAAAVGLATPASAAPPAVAFIDVNVLPMDGERVLEHQTVVTSGRLIAAMGPTGTVAVPPGARRIPGAGLWLTPGLADMHVHVDDDSELALFVRSGVTTALHMGGADPTRIAPTRRAIAEGARVGPTLYYALLLNGDPTIGATLARTPAEAKAAVDRGKAQGFDLLKVYNGLTSDAFDAIVEEGRLRNMAVIGHGVRTVGLPEGLFRGQVMVAHAEEFFYTAFGNRADPANLPAVVEATRRSGAWVTPNLSGFAAIVGQWGRPSVAQAHLAEPDAAGLSPLTRESWAKAPYGTRSGDLSPMLAFLQTFTKALSDADVPLLTGTDAPFIPGMAPGVSLHQDLRILVRAGLTPYQALAAATRSPGAFIARTIPGAEPFGQVRAGMRADLLLVTGNPLNDLSVLETPKGVMAAGRWHSAAALARRPSPAAPAPEPAPRRP